MQVENSYLRPLGGELLETSECFGFEVLAYIVRHFRNGSQVWTQNSFVFHIDVIHRLEICIALIKFLLCLYFDCDLLYKVGCGVSYYGIILLLKRFRFGSIGK